MRTNRIALPIILFALSANGYADIYRYQGPLYLPGDIDSGAYATDMRVSGYIMTSQPIPPNQADFALQSILTGYSLSDGLQAINKATSKHTTITGVSTDANGLLSMANFAVSDFVAATAQLNDVGGSIQAANAAYEAARLKCTASSTQCDTVDVTDYAASQVTLDVSWVHEAGEIVAEHHIPGLNGVSIGWWNQPAGKNSVGQSFTPNGGGQLLRVLFKLAASQEAINDSKNLTVEFWNTDQSGLPVGQPLATRTVAASSFTAAGLREVKTVNFESDHIMLEPQTRYAFTLSVANVADTPGTSLYNIGVDPNGEFNDGAFLQSAGGGSFFEQSLDLEYFEVTADGVYLYKDGFEAP